MTPAPCTGPPRPQTRSSRPSPPPAAACTAGGFSPTSRARAGPPWPRRWTVSRGKRWVAKLSVFSGLLPGVSDGAAAKLVREPAGTVSRARASHERERRVPRARLRRSPAGPVSASAAASPTVSPLRRSQPETSRPNAHAVPSACGRVTADTPAAVTRRASAAWPRGDDQLELAEVAAGQRPGQRGQDRPVSPGQPQGFDLALDNGDLVAQDQDLGVLGAVRTGEQGEPAEYLEHREVSESSWHEH